MTIAGRDRRGLTEIVAVAGMAISTSAVLVAQIVKGHDPDHMLMGGLMGLILLITGRGVQSSMERGASSELRNYESQQLQLANAEMRRTAVEVQRVAAELQQAHVETINRVLLLVAAPQHKDKG